MDKKPWNLFEYNLCYGLKTLIKKIFMAPFYGWVSTASRPQSQFEEAVYFLSLSSQKLVVLILSVSERWKTESTLEPPSGFEQGIKEREFLHKESPSSLRVEIPTQVLKLLSPLMRPLWKTAFLLLTLLRGCCQYLSIFLRVSLLH